ncbi:MAG TPA: DUF3999 family protein [Pyrinomonadaceae bacterium]|jgi:hypothetical protein|nr:DUF3999 family protein [Pyrinomonadaceae bacterium]
MKKLAFITFICMSVALGLVMAAAAQTSMSSWRFFIELNATAPGFYSLTVPLDVLDKSRADLADLRLQDASGKEIPYALWIRKDVDEQRELSGRIFNRATKGSASEVSVDLGAEVDLGTQGVEHNEVEIETPGTNFRRRVEVEGSDNGKDWKGLKSGDVIFGFGSENRSVQSNRVDYPTSRYRYLRVRVFADELADKQAPEISSVRAIAAVRQKGERVSWQPALPTNQLLRYQGVPASEWTIDLGARVPCDRILIDVNAISFSRPYQLEAVDDPQNVRLLASGELKRRVGEEAKPLEIAFDQEEQVRKLRLVVDDYSNQTLPIESFTAQAPARQLIFELKQAPAQPLRLYFGNANATPTHYDFEKDLSARLTTSPIRTEGGQAAQNPEYKPEPLPLTERVPWLIYLVLFASSAALALVLLSLARSTMRMTAKDSGDQAAESSS